MKEMFYRKLSFLFGWLIISLAVSLYVIFFTMTKASQAETIRLTRDMGLNVSIIPAEASIEKFWTLGYSDKTMPESIVKRFYDFKDFSFAHVTAILKKSFRFNGTENFLIGILPDFEPSGIKKSNMVFTIKANHVYVGYEIVRKNGFIEGGIINIDGRDFIVEKTLGETGSNEDITLYMCLEDAQSILEMPGKINEIKALNCLCINPETSDPLDVLREQVEQIIPGAKLTLNKTIAEARERQRIMLDEYFAIILPVVFFVAVLWIMALSWLNARDRKYEVGILRAVGYGFGKIGLLFISRSGFIGFFGAIAGFILGTYISFNFGDDIFMIAKSSITIDYSLLIKILIATPLFAIISTLIPVAIILTSSPAIILNEEL